MLSLWFWENGDVILIWLYLMSPPSPPKGSGMGIEPRPSTSRLLGWMANKHASPRLKESVYISFFWKINKQIRNNWDVSQIWLLIGITDPLKNWDGPEIFTEDQWIFATCRDGDIAPQKFAPQGPKSIQNPLGYVVRSIPETEHLASGIPNSHAFKSHIFPINCYQLVVYKSLIFEKAKS